MGGGLNGQDAYTGRVLAQNYPEDASTFDPRAIGDIKESDTTSTIRANTGGGGETQNPAFVMQPGMSGTGVSGPIDANYGKGPGSRAGTERDVVVSGPDKERTYLHPVPRRLTPLECERLQGFPDEWTQVEWKGKPMSDGPRYKMLGNAVTVNVAEWIGYRIVAVEEFLRQRAEAE